MIQRRGVVDGVSSCGDGVGGGDGGRPLFPLFLLLLGVAGDARRLGRLVSPPVRRLFLLFPRSDQRSFLGGVVFRLLAPLPQRLLIGSESGD